MKKGMDAMSTKGVLAKERFRVKGGVLSLRFEDWVSAEGNFSC